MIVGKGWSVDGTKTHFAAFPIELVDADFALSENYWHIWTEQNVSSTTREPWQLFCYSGSQPVCILFSKDSSGSVETDFIYHKLSIVGDAVESQAYIEEQEYKYFRPGLASVGMIDRFAVFDTFTAYYNIYAGYESFYALGMTRLKLYTSVSTNNWVPYDENSEYLFSFVSNQLTDDVRRNLWET